MTTQQSNQHQHDTQNTNLKIMQHNYARFTNVMHSLLQYAANCKIDILLIQKPWIRAFKELRTAIGLR